MQKLNDRTFRNFVSQDRVAIVMFGAPDAGRATMDQAQAFALAWANRRGDARFGYLDALANSETCAAFNVRLLPTIIVFHNGHVVRTLTGFQSCERIEASIDFCSRYELDLVA